jgi:GDP-L-fucose synthase
VAGINGMVGSHVASRALQLGYKVVGKSSSELDFTDRKATFKELELEQPDVLIIAAAIVGGIGANLAEPVKFLTDNLQIQSNLIDGAFAAKIERLVFLGSSCIYPKLGKQPLIESELLSGHLESSNKPYAIAKLAGIELVDAYRNQFGMKWISAIPCNLYGSNDNFSTESSHVLAALVRKIHLAKLSNAKSVTIWGDGSPLREFLNVEDASAAILHLVQSEPEDSVFNLGSDEEISVKDLASLISKIVGYEGEFEFDETKPNGTPRKLMSSTRIRALGWQPRISLETGIREMYEWFKLNYED